MATIIQIKRTTTANLPSELNQGEMAYIYDTSVTDTDAGGNGGRLFIGDPTSNTNTPIKVGGEYYTLSHPTSDGSAGQFLKTDGNGNLSFDTVTQSLSIAADSGSNDAVSTGETITFSGGTGLTTTVTDNEISIALDDTAVTAGVYGSSTEIPTFTVDAQGRLTDAGTASISTTLTVAADSGSGDGVALADDTLTISGGEGIDTSVSGDTITIAAEDASDTNKGVATFNNADFAVSSGDVTIKTGGVSNTQLAGSIANAKLSNSSVTVTAGDGLSGGGEVSLGSSVSLAVSVDDTTIETNADTLRIKDSGVSNAKLANDSITIGSDSTALGTTITDINGLTSLDVDNLTLDGNTVTSTDTNGDINLTPDGTGTVIVPSGYEGRAGFQSQSLVNKAYVDSVANGLDVKASVRVATTADLSATYNNSNGTLTANANGAISIDGVSLSADDRVLVKDQTDPVENGFYKVTNAGGASAAFVLTRTPDANQFSGAGQISAGDGLTKTGNTLDVSVDDSSIEISGDSLQVKASGITNAMLAGSIANAKLVNDSVTINSNSVALGASITLDTGDIGEGSNLYFTDARARSAVSISAGTGLAYNSSTGVFSGVNATTSVKGVASFSSDNFTVASGAVSISAIDGGTY